MGDGVNTAVMVRGPVTLVVDNSIWQYCKCNKNDTTLKQ